MSIAKKIVVRHRAEGHVRFAVPSELCDEEASQQLERELRRVEGVYRVEVFRRQGKLSIRYIEGVTHFKAVARALFAALDNIGPQPDCCASKLANRQGQGDQGWLQSKLQELKETLTALGIVTRNVGNAQTLEMTPEMEKFASEFFTDVLVLYLIKLHWHLIMGHWIRNPWQYRSEWMATIYMIYLLVRSKKPKK